MNNRDADRQSYISAKSVDSGLSDIFETSKEDLDNIPGEMSFFSKDMPGVSKDSTFCWLRNEKYVKLQRARKGLWMRMALY